jgi:prepilin-type N-terminal cleavage/methylation domain-containing protein
MPPELKPKLANGFTLVELMIVVAIIGILAAIITINFSSSIQKSGEALTKGNLGAIRSALSIYYGDNEGIYPEDDLTSLNNNSRYLQTIPLTRIQPYHPDSTLVTPEVSLTETGGWSYNNSDMDPGWGAVHVGCLHADSRSIIWSTY